MARNYPVTVTTVMLPGGDESHTTMNWNSPRERQWLTNHMHWAMMNGRGVALTPPPVQAAESVRPNVTDRFESLYDIPA